MSEIGVLLINLGTPDSPDPASVRRYLAEFLSDRRVVEIPPIAWKPLLYGVILPTRPRRSAEAYRQVWTDEGSPLAVITERQTRALRQRLGKRAHVDFAMRYGSPGIADAVDRMARMGCARILAAPLYPQYCAATTATANDAVFAALAAKRVQPALRTLPPYYADPLYIEALRANFARQLGALDYEPQRLLLSFHGMPQRTRELGDPYYDQCLETARLLSGALGREVDVAFQSRFGRAKWLEPATDEVLARYGGDTITKVAVAAPGFSADCLETLEELGIRARETFLAGGGKDFALLECLNDSPEGLAMLEQLIRRELEGWLPAA
ncbi:MAG TPA: ferrochelatase [Sphingomicrobium sp.]